MIGFPYDDGKREFDEGFGEYLGPHSLRWFIGYCGVIRNLEWGITLDNIKVSDYGNINPTSPEGSSLSPENPEIPYKYFKLKSKVTQLIHKNQFPIIIGGTADLSPFVHLACKDTSNNIIKIDISSI